MNYWQISAEIGNTNLIDIFFDLGVAIVGPGDKEIILTIKKSTIS